MKITKRQLRRIIKEYGRKPSSQTRGSRRGMEPVITKIIGREEVDAAWSPSGLTMYIHVNNQPALSFSSQKDVRDMIDLLEELLAGPMRTSP